MIYGGIAGSLIAIFTAFNMIREYVPDMILQAEADAVHAVMIKTTEEGYAQLDSAVVNNTAQIIQMQINATIDALFVNRDRQAQLQSEGRSTVDLKNHERFLLGEQGRLRRELEDLK